MLDQAVEAILGGVDELLAGLRGEMNGRFDKVEGRLEKVELRLDKVEVELAHVKDTVNGLIADLAESPSRREFEQLKTRVDKHHPLS